MPGFGKGRAADGTLTGEHEFSRAYKSQHNRPQVFERARRQPGRTSAIDPDFRLPEKLETRIRARL